MVNGNYRLYCAVYGCLNSSLTHRDMSFFKLPSKPERRLEWLQLICRSDLENKPKHSVYRICEKHFNADDIRQTEHRKLLKRNALPLLMLPSFLPRTVTGGTRREDKQTQTALTDLKVGVENCKETQSPPDYVNFIQQHPTPGPSHQNEHSTAAITPIENINVEYKGVDIEVVKVESVKEEQENEEDSISEDFASETASTQSGSTKFTNKDEHFDEETLKQSLRDISDQLQSLTQNNDCFDAFGRYVASIMRRMPMEKAMELQPKIVELLVEGMMSCDDKKEAKC